MVEANDVWKIIAQDKLSLAEFKDQLVHQKLLTIPIFLSPVTVDSLNFKNRMEISDFGDQSERGDYQPKFRNPLL
jgi:hypothetical protein